MAQLVERTARLEISPPVAAPAVTPAAAAEAAPSMTLDAAAIALKDHAQNAARDLQAIITAQNAKEDAMAHGMHRERHPSQYGNGGVPMGQPIPMGMNRGRGMF